MNLRADPHRSDPRRDVFSAERFGFHLFQRGDVHRELGITLCTLTGSVDSVIGVIARTSQTATSVSTRSQELSEQARRLSDEVKQFIVALRSGPLDRRKGRDATYTGRDRRAA